MKEVINELDIVKEHVQVTTFEQIIEYPEHEKRKGTSSLFRKNVTQLKNDGNYVCFVCGAKEDLQVHHFICEWSLAENIDYKKLKKICELFDPYGYGEKMKDIEMESVDDIRNLIVLSRKHHERKVTGIHNTTFSAWCSQLICKDGEEIVPQDHNKIEKLIKEHEYIN